MLLYDYILQSMSDLFDWQRALPFYIEIPVAIAEFMLLVWVVVKTAGMNK